MYACMRTCMILYVHIHIYIYIYIYTHIICFFIFVSISYPLFILIPLGISVIGLPSYAARGPYVRMKAEEIGEELKNI